MGRAYLRVSHGRRARQLRLPRLRPGGRFRDGHPCRSRRVQRPAARAPGGTRRLDRRHFPRRGSPDLAARGGSQRLEFQLGRDCYDLAYVNNDALWVDWFCPTITPQSRGIFAGDRNLGEVVRDFIESDRPLPNPHLRPWAGRLDDRELRGVFLPCSPREGRDAGDPAAWLGVRLLDDAQLDRLATECVRPVQRRGPFLNLSDFVNRR